MLCRPISNDTFSVLELTIMAVDGGTPARGTIVNITVTLSNTCLYDAVNEAVEVKLYIDIADSGLYLRVPKYYAIVFGK